MPKHRTNAGAVTAARVAAGYTQRGAARLLPCTAAHVSQVEAGTCGASPGLLKAMADLYGVAMDTLYDLDESAA